MEMSKNFVKLQQEELNIAEIINLVTFSNCGAISNFIGITRDNFENKKVIKLEYEAYESMALKEMVNICTKIRAQWNIEGIAIYHRIGEVPISEASIVIAVSSPHRQESLKAVEYAINEFKASVPIWKKEVYETGETQWKENKECAWINTLKSRDVKTARNINEEISSKITIDPNLVQIQADSEELNRRIKSFIERKRQQVNTVNVQEFCCHSERNDNENSCARVDAILIRRKDSKSHVRVHRVLNTWGPQTMDQSILHKAILNNTSHNTSCFPVLDDRISTTERIIGINKPVPKDIYERLKNIEDRILYLESISPEYKEFWATEDITNLKNISTCIRKRTYSTAELDFKLYELEDKYVKKMK
ncbi:molybdopterin synthase catalytic subunit-like isoform X1 [Anoplolepis gracilipes]